MVLSTFKNDRINTSRKMDFSRLVILRTPVHSAFVMAMCKSRNCRYDSALFGLAVVIGLIVMYDAAGVRRAAGKQAAVLNKIIEEIEHDELHFEERLKELLGHTPVEVIVGAFLGIVIGLTFF